MTIEINMQLEADRQKFHSDHQLKFETAEGLTCIMLSGMVKLDFKGNSDGWRKEEFKITARIPAPPSGKELKLHSWVPLVTGNSFQNENHAVNSGDAVTRFGLALGESQTLSGPYITFDGQVGVRDVDQRITSLAYHATLLGEYIDAPEIDLI